MFSFGNLPIAWAKSVIFAIRKLFDGDHCENNTFSLALNFLFYFFL
jgi:hypothetical protein